MRPVMSSSVWLAVLLIVTSCASTSATSSFPTVDVMRDDIDDVNKRVLLDDDVTAGAEDDVTDALDAELRGLMEVSM